MVNRPPARKKPKGPFGWPTKRISTEQFLELAGVSEEAMEAGAYPIEEGEKGGPGSGNWGHTSRTRIGQVGGSDPGGGLAFIGATDETRPKVRSALAANKRLARVMQPDSERGAWQATTQERGRMKDRIVRDLCADLGLDADDPETYQDVNLVVKQWSYTASNRDMRALSIQQAVAEKFGVPMSPWAKEKIDTLAEQRERTIERYMSGRGTGVMSYGARTRERAETLTQDLNPQFYPLAKQTSVTDIAVWSTMYDRTQALLKDAGFSPDDTIRLYRGVELKPKDAAQVQPGMPVRGNPIESWTLDTTTADVFGMPYTGSGLHGLRLTCDIAVRDIISLPLTGAGCWTESEVIVLGSRERPLVDVVEPQVPR